MGFGAPFSVPTSSSLSVLFYVSKSLCVCLSTLLACLVSMSILHVYLVDVGGSSPSSGTVHFGDVPRISRVDFHKKTAVVMDTYLVGGLEHECYFPQ